MANLREEAMLIRQKTRQWTASKSDKRIKDAAVATHGVSGAAVRGGQKLLLGGTDGQAKLDAVGSLYGAASRMHLAATLPWLDNGARVLTAAQFDHYMGQTRAIKASVDSAVDELAAWYSNEYYAGTMLANCRRELNGLFELRDYPLPERLTAMFALEPEVLPFPAADDFRVDLGAGEVGRIRRQIEASIETAIQAAMADVWERIGATVGHLAERLRAYDPSGDKVVGKFHDTVTLNVRELVGLLPGLNVTHDPRVAEITAELGAMVARLPGVGSTDGKDDAAGRLREDEALRRDTAAAAEAIMAKMEAFV